MLTLLYYFVIDFGITNNENGTCNDFHIRKKYEALTVLVCARVLSNINSFFL